MFREKRRRILEESVGMLIAFGWYRQDRDVDPN